MFEMLRILKQHLSQLDQQYRYQTAAKAIQQYYEVFKLPLAALLTPPLPEEPPPPNLVLNLFLKSLITSSSSGGVWLLPPQGFYYFRRSKPFWLQFVFDSPEILYHI